MTFSNRSERKQLGPIETKIEKALTLNATSLDLSTTRSTNRITSLPRSIEQLKRLAYLNLRGQNIAKLPKFIKNLPNLQKLDLVGNPIEFPDLIPEILIDNFIFENNKEKIDVSRVVGIQLSGINAMPEYITTLKSLRHLSIIDSKIRTVPDEIYRIENLSTLSISNTKVSSISTSIQALTYLEKLSLNANRFYAFPEEITTLHWLKTLNISKNTIQELPTSIMNMDSLEHLNLDCNFLTTLPLSIGELVNLEQLSLMNNHISEIPLTVEDLKKLEVLLLTNNDLPEFPKPIYKLQQLKVLSLDNTSLFGENRKGCRNRISEISIDIFRLKNLISFTMRDNLIPDPPITAKKGTVENRKFWYFFRSKIGLGKDEPVHISYAWEKESERIADLLEETLAKNKIKVARDKTSIDYGDSIRGFMDALTKGRYIVVIISNKYLKSENCMYELIQAEDYGQLRGRIFPIILDTSIYSTDKRIDIISYWENCYSALEKKYKDGVSMENSPSISEKVFEVSKIKRGVDMILNTLKDINAMTAQHHIDDNFKTIIKKIRTSALGNAISDIANRNGPS